MKRLLRALVRWPLLLGAVTFLSIAGVIGIKDGNGGAIAASSSTLGCVLLGAWLWDQANDHDEGPPPAV